MGTSISILQDEREDGAALARVVLELLPIIAVLGQSPDGHLEGSSKGKQISSEARGQHGEGNPGTDLVGVVWARNQAKVRGNAN